MKYNSKISAAVAAILAVPAGAWAADAAVSASATSSGNEIAEITVTAQRRSENIQNVPISIQALTAETLGQLNVTTFDDYVKYLPNVTSAGYGPGQNLIFMRGLSTGALGTQGSGTDADFPNVAVYLDDQSAQMPYRNLDIYAADIERIEVLEGPQGTLFGAGAEAGVVRYITNKPKINVTEGIFNGGYSVTAGGDPNSNFDATLNLPLITDKVAIRAVVYNDSRGGYINNVPQTFTRSNTDIGIYYAGGAVPKDSPVINNNSQVAKDINPVTYQGVRASVLWQVNDDWNVLLAQSYQNMNAQGVFFQMPFGSDSQFNHQHLPDLSVTLFNPSYDKDKFEDTALTVNGKIGDLRVVYTGGYLVRNVDAQQDYTNYSRGAFADFYQCTKTVGYGVPGPTNRCYSPSAYWRNTQKNTHQSHELRVSTPDEWRLRAIGGAFWEDFKVYDNTDWFYKTVPACTATVTFGCLSNIAPAIGSTTNVPGVRPDNESFFDDVQRGYKQYAFFGSVDFDLIPKVLTVTAGTRYYHFDNFQTGSDGGGFGCQNAGPAPCYVGNNMDALNLKTTYTGFKSRANITYKITPDIMVYYTWSQGFRPGGFNRTSALHANDANGVGQYFTPQTFAPDFLTNNELGFKTEWFDHRVQLNGAVYQEVWKDVQLQFFDPVALGNLSFVTNGANYRVRGLELQLVWQPMRGLTVQSSASWNRSEQLNSPFLVNNNPDSPTFGQPITTIRQSNGELVTGANPYGPPGSHLADSPSFQGNVRVRYEVPFNSYLAFVQVGASRQGASLSATGNVPPIAAFGATHQQFNQPGFTTYDASFGVSKDNWSVQAFGQNLGDTRGLTFISASEAIETQTVIRPRVLGMRVGWKF